MTATKARPVLGAACAVGVLATLAACGGGAAGDAANGGEEGYPTDDITVIVPFGAGGTTDAPTRAFAPCLEKELGVSLVIENVEGGAGTIGITQLVNSEPDGYTLGVISPSSGVVAPLVTEGVDYGPDDLQPLGIMYGTSSVLAVSADSPYGSAEELFAAAANETIDIASPGANTAYSFEIRRLAEEHGVELQVVPFDSDAEVRNAVLGGNVDAMFSTAAPATLELGATGELKMFATGGPERPAYATDLPTLAELGYEGIVYSPTFFSVAGPAGLPEQVSSTLTAALETCRKDPEVRGIIGEEFMQDDFTDGAEVATLLRELQSTFEPLV
jgi:tripartite-type tricarboxylate transporter receptor subunit TctC